MAGVSRKPAVAFAEVVALVAEGVALGVVVVVGTVLVGDPVVAEDGCNVEEKLGLRVEHVAGMDAPAGMCAVVEVGVAGVEAGKGVAAVEMDAAGVDVAAEVDAVVEMDAAEAEEDAAVVEGVAAATDVEAGAVVVEADVAAVGVVEDVVEHCDVAEDAVGYGEHCDAAGAAAECDDID